MKAYYTEKTEELLKVLGLLKTTGYGEVLGSKSVYIMDSWVTKDGVRGANNTNNLTNPTKLTQDEFLEYYLTRNPPEPKLENLKFGTKISIDGLGKYTLTKLTHTQAALVGGKGYTWNGIFKTDDHAKDVSRGKLSEVLNGYFWEII